jgi:tRNA (guanine-N7-)-methyltransferase
MSRSLKYDIPGVDPRVSLDEFTEKGWAALFCQASVPDGTFQSRRRVLEVGFGRGEFLLAMAEQEPDVEFLGIEVSYKRTLKMARKVARARHGNIRLIEAAAERAIQEVCAAGSLDAIWVNFSDPWPKVRHGHRRVIQSKFVSHAASVLRPGGTLFIATDDVPYAHQINEVLSSESRLVNTYSPWPFLPAVSNRIPTGYEEQWLAVGRPMHFFAYQVRSDCPQ